VGLPLLLCCSAVAAFGCIFFSAVKTARQCRQWRKQRRKDFFFEQAAVNAYRLGPGKSRPAGRRNPNLKF